MSPFLKKTLHQALCLVALFLFSGTLLLLEKPTGSLKGIVRNERGEPLKGAKVRIDRGSFQKIAVTNEQGEFQLDLIPVGSYYLNISRKGYEYYYAPHQTEIKRSKMKELGSIQLKERAPNLVVSLWENTKTSSEKITLSLSGAKVKQVQFTAYRVDLIKYLSQGGSVWDFEKEEFNPALLNYAEKVKEWEEAIPEGEIEEFDRKAIAPIQENGVYLVRSVGSSTDRTLLFSRNLLVNKTDLGFVAKRDDSKLLVYATSFLNGEPAGGAEVYLVKKGAAPQTVSAGKDGVAEIPMAPASPGEEESQWLVVRHQGNVAFLVPPREQAQEESTDGEGEGEAAEENSEEGQPPPAKLEGRPKLFLYTERPIYRPGQKIYFKGILRTENATKGGYTVVPPTTVSFHVETPKGNTLYENQFKTNPFGSFWGEFDLEEEGEVGFYNLVATVNGKTFKQDFSVEEYRKPEFKLEITPEKSRYFSGESVKFLLDTQYYFGAPVEGAELEYTVYKANTYFTLPGEEVDPYRSYGEDSYVSGYGEVVDEGKMTADQKGHALLEVKTTPLEQDQRYTIRVTAKDLSEKTVTREGEVLVTAGDFFFRTQKTEFFANAKRTFPLAILTRDYDGKPVSRDYQIAIEKEKYDKIAKDYVYEKQKTLNGKTNEQGEARASLTIDEGGYYRLAITGKDSKGRRVLFHDYLWVSGSSGDSEFSLKKNLQIVADKKKYETGETAKVLIVGPVKNAPVLITIEGPRILEHRIERLDGFSKQLELPLKKEWMPNIFITVSIVGKKTFYDSTAELKISPKEKFVQVSIEPNAQKYRPAEEAIYKVTTKDAAGKPISAELSLGVVDESVYALRADATDIKKFFWGPRPNRVGTNYSFSGYYTGGIEKEDKNLLRKNFKDTAYWIPSLVTNDQGEATVSLKLPDNLTTWRATVLVHTGNTDVGQQIQKVIASKDLIARVALPRFFTERDKVQLKGFVHNYTDQPQTVTVSLELEGIEFADAKDNQPRSLTISPQKVASFDFWVLPKKAGNAKVRMLAKNAALSDGVELPVPVLAHGFEEHRYVQGEIRPASSESDGMAGAQVSLPLPSQIDPTRAKLQITLDTHFVAQLIGSLNYLVEYPYGCVEQTMSRFLPAMVVSHLYQTVGLKDSNLEKKIPKVIQKSIRRILKMQHGDGGWGWWVDDQTHPFMTAYALYGLMRADQMGQKVNPEVLEKGKKALEEILKKGVTSQSTNYHLHAKESWEDSFIDYVASLAKVKNPILHNEDFRYAPPMNQALRILSLMAQKRIPEAKALMQQLEAKAVCAHSLCSFVNSPNEKWHYDDTEATAWALHALVMGGSENAELKKGLARWLLAQRKGGAWRHTRETAFVLYALTEYSKDLQQGAQGVRATLALNGEELEKINVASPHFVRKLNNPKVQAGSNTLLLQNLLAAPLYYQADLTFFSQEENLAESSQGIRVKREYLKIVSDGKDSEGKRRYKTIPLQGKIQKGEMIGVRLTVETNESRSYVIVEDPLPSGFEVVQEIQFDDNLAYSSSMEVRDEKIALFSNLLWGKDKYIYNYVLRPELAGSFHVMPTLSYEMYRPEIRGSGAEARLEVE